MNNGQTKPGYNVQIATENQYIVNYDLYWRPTDYGTLIPFLQSFHDKFGFYSSEIVADSGYGSEQNYEFMFANGMTPYVKYNLFHKEMKRKFLKTPFHKANSYKSSAKELLTSQRGLMHRSNRPIEPEACFGNIKFNHGFKRFHLKSARKTKVEWGLVSLAHNLRKYVAYKAKLKNKQAHSMVIVLVKPALMLNATI